VGKMNEVDILYTVILILFAFLCAFTIIWDGYNNETDFICNEAGFEEYEGVDFEKGIIECSGELEKKGEIKINESIIVDKK
jgi:hypothetical protein